MRESVNGTQSCTTDKLISNERVDHCVISYHHPLWLRRTLLIHAFVNYCAHHALWLSVNRIAFGGIAINITGLPYVDDGD